MGAVREGKASFLCIGREGLSESANMGQTPEPAVLRGQPSQPEESSTSHRPHQSRDMVLESKTSRVQSMRDNEALFASTVSFPDISLPAFFLEGPWQ